METNFWAALFKYLWDNKILSIFSALFFVHVYIAATKPENFKVIYGGIIFFFARLFTGLRKNAVRFKIEGPCTKALKNLSRELPELDIPSLNISWVNEDNALTKLQEGKAIVKLRFENDDTRNIIKATTIYVRDAFLSKAKVHLSANFKQAIDFSVSKKILLQLSQHNSNLITQFYQENTINDNAVFEKCERIENLDDSGLLTRILLRELNSFGNLLFGRVAKEEYKSEADEFLNFISTISDREYNDDTPLEFPKNTIKVAVVLVAKPETYHTHGLNPYLRRIKLGMTQGVKTFYLLARSESVEILQRVALELVQSGNFIQRYEANEYQDRQHRRCICYCITVNNDSILSNSIKEITDALTNSLPVQGVVTKVRSQNIFIDINGIEGNISLLNLSVLPITNPEDYFKEGMTINAIPLEIRPNQKIELTLRNTNSDPNFLFSTKFTIGSIIKGKVTYADDSFIKVDIGNENITGFAYRADLTKSKYIFLHHKFKLDEEFEFKIKGYNYEKANVILELNDLSDPWPMRGLKVGKQVDFSVYKTTGRAYHGEISEGIEAVLKFQQIDYFGSKKSPNIKLNDVIKCRVTQIDNQDKCVFLSMRDTSNNPYQVFFDSNKNKTFEFTVEQINEYGINGKLNHDPAFNIYIPKFELSWNGNSAKHNVNDKVQVVIKDLHENGDKLIGTFKPLLPHPLSKFMELYKEGDIIDSFDIVECNDYGIKCKVKAGKNVFNCFLPMGEITNLGFLDSCLLLKSIKCPAIVRKIDLEKQRVILSFKQLFTSNRSKIIQLEYGQTYTGFVLGSVNGNYIVYIKDYNVEGLLEPNGSTVRIGTEITVMPSRISKDLILARA